MKLAREPRYPSLIEQGHEARLAGRYPEAVQFYQQAVTEYQRHHTKPNTEIAHALCGMGCAMYQQGYLKLANQRLAEGCTYLIEALTTQRKGTLNEIEQLVGYMQCHASVTCELSDPGHAATARVGAILALRMLGPAHPATKAYLQAHPLSEDEQAAIHKVPVMERTPEHPSITFAPPLQMIAMLLNQEPSQVTRSATHDSIPMSDHDVVLAKRLQKEFQTKFGRPQGPKDHVFFDPFADTPKKLSLWHYARGIAYYLELAGIGPEFVHAFKQTGSYITEYTHHHYSARKIRKWEDAIQAYRDQSGRAMG